MKIKEVVMEREPQEPQVVLAEEVAVGVDVEENDRRNASNKDNNLRHHHHHHHHHQYRRGENQESAAMMMVIVPDSTTSSGVGSDEDSNRNNGLNDTKKRAAVAADSSRAGRAPRTGAVNTGTTASSSNTFDSSTLAPARAPSSSAAATAEEDSGYTSDLSPDGTTSSGQDEEEEEEEEELLLGSSSSSESDFLMNIYNGDNSCSETDDASDGSISSKIGYIGQKQELLTRYSEALAQEERYDAATAADVAARLCCAEEEDRSSLWNTAKEILRTISQKAGELRINESTPRRLRFAAAAHSRSQRGPPNPKDPKISLSSVKKLTSVNFDRNATAACAPSPFMDGGRDAFGPGGTDSVFGEGQVRVFVFVRNGERDERRERILFQAKMPTTLYPFHHPPVLPTRTVDGESADLERR